MNNSRREFFKKVATFIGGALLLPIIGHTEERRRGGGDKKADGGLPLATPGQGPAKPLNYHHTKADFKDASLKTERQGVAWDKQTCAGCQFYPNKDAATGPCQVMPGVSVKATGWCTSWAKRA